MTSQAPPEPDIPVVPQPVFTGPLRPSGVWYLLGVLLILAAIASPIVVATTRIGRAGRKVVHATEEGPVLLEADVPGEHEVALAFPGRYEVLYQYSGTVAGSQYDTPSDLPGLQGELTDAAGEAVDLKPFLSIPSNYEPHGFAPEPPGRVKLWDFDVDEGGTYQLKLSYRDPAEGGPERIILLIEPDLTHAFPSRFFEVWRVMMLTGFASFVLLALGVTVLIVVGVKRSGYQRRMLAQAAEMPS